LAAVIGIFVYRALSLAPWLNLLIADVVATIFTFIISVALNNASVYDPYWSVQPIVIVVAFACVYGLNAMGILLLTVICLWGLRLTANWAYTFHGLTHQDWRYTMLKQTTGKWYPFVNFFGIHLVPTLVVYLVTMPAVTVIMLAPAFNVRAILYVFVSVLAFTMQGIADVQMHKFRKEKKGTFIRDGLWKYSRHPNYLGEILMWWGVALASICVLPKMWWMITGAIANTLLFLGISIPMADKRQSKKDGFPAYKEQTRMLFPLKKV
jgi:steroid 5-alpha reductase family enzyme